MNKFIAWITSMRLAIGLIAYLAIACVLATLVPQGLSDDGYRQLYPKFAARLVIQTGFGGFFDSVLFIVPALVFFANLSACTVKRLVREARKRGARRHGPDILHLGLMALVIGGVWSYSGQWRGSVTLAPGEVVNLPDGAVLRLDDFRYERYPDGRPKDWVSVVSLIKDGEVVEAGFELRVNRPLRYGELTFYQVSYEELPSPSPDGPSGTERRARLASGIEAVSDPGYPLVLVALALVGLGTAWTFAQKLKEGV